MTKVGPSNGNSTKGWIFKAAGHARRNGAILAVTIDTLHFLSWVKSLRGLTLEQNGISKNCLSELRTPLSNRNIRAGRNGDALKGD